MDLTREVAFEMAKAGTVVILQKMVVVKESDLPVKGIMRIRLAVPNSNYSELSTL
jgi:hypothetical protein